MDTISINKFLTKFKINFHGTFPSDAALKIKKLPAYFIINTDESNKPGEHWIAIYVDKNKSGEYFDPYGIPPVKKNIIKNLNNLCYYWTYNKCLIQSLNANSIACGYHCIVYCILKYNNWTLEQICNFFAENNSKEKNDHESQKVVNDYIKIIDKNGIRD